MSLFKKAERKRSYLKIAATGPSGSGKTMSGLLLASGLGKKIALIDTENGSASLYSDKAEFDVLEIGAPFTTEKYIAAIKAAEDAGYDVLIIDSLTHAWKGPGGLLEQKEQLDARGGNSFANFAKITPKDNALRSAILQCKMHVICTMRSKQDWVLTDKNGKQVPQKVGLAPEQRDGIEYEFTTVLDIAMNHQAQASKDRTGLFDGQTFTITADTGKALLGWLSGAKEVPPAAPSMPEPPHFDVDESWDPEPPKEEEAFPFQYPEHLNGIPLSNFTIEDIDAAGRSLSTYEKKIKAKGEQPPPNVGRWLNRLREEYQSRKASSQ